MREMSDKWLGLLMYLSMIDKHIIYVKSKGNVFNDATFLIQMHVLVMEMY
jgi:hypothetical protein